MTVSWTWDPTADTALKLIHDAMLEKNIALGRISELDGLAQ